MSQPMPPDEPFCGHCGYRPTGLTESSRCPECGRPLVEVLRRASFTRRRGRRYRSSRTLFGVPLVDVAVGPHADGPRGKARGIVAVGDDAVGVVAVGGSAAGGLAIGGASVGLVAAGGAAIGVAALGGATIGVFAVGGAALGLFRAVGGAAFTLKR